MWAMIKDRIGKLPYKYIIYLFILVMMVIMMESFALYFYLDYRGQREEAGERPSIPRSRWWARWTSGWTI